MLVGSDDVCPGVALYLGWGEERAVKPAACTSPDLRFVGRLFFGLFLPDDLR